jgi:hypothetical protein
MTHYTGTRRPVRMTGVAVGITLTALAVACTSAPLLLPQPISVNANARVTRAAILNGMALRGWAIEKEEPNRVLARLNSRTHVAQVWIDYAGSKIQFRYGGSTSLGCVPAGDSCSAIHRSYNRWVFNLSQDISGELTRQRAKDASAVAGAGAASGSGRN